MEIEIRESRELPQDDVAGVNQLGQVYQAFRAELKSSVVGQDQVIEQIAICLFASGNALLMGVPGLAKTLLISSVAKTMDLSFRRIQFTPDLMPADITGTEIIQEDQRLGRREFEFIKGPIFANLVLADEINRAPAKTQSAMLEAMQEHKVTILGKTHELPTPFFVFATQNPIEQEGTYALPEAQLDRFMFLIELGYPSREEEIQIAKMTPGGMSQRQEQVLDAAQLLGYQQLVRRVPVPEYLYDYAVQLVRMTRPDEEESPEWLKSLVSWGAGPRAVQYLILGGKSRAALHGRYIVTREDLEAVAPFVLNHRVILHFSAEAQGMNTKNIVERLILEQRDSYRVPRS